MRKLSVGTAVLSAALFGLATPLSKILLRDLNSFQLAGLLYCGAGVGLLPFAFVKRKTRKGELGRSSLLRVAGAVVFGGMLGPVLLLFGLQRANAASVSLWLNLELAATAVLGWMFFRDHLDLRTWLGVLGALVAGVLITAHEGAAGMIAGGLVALACVCWGLDNQLTAVIDALTPTQVTLIKGLVAGPINLAIGVSMMPLPQMSRVVAPALAVGVVSYGLSMALYITASHGLGATRSQVLFASAPFFGAFFSVLLVSETISGIQALAAFILAVSLLSILRRSHAHEHEHEASEHVH
ncbi:MAG: DMT family transporter, partial [Candidatus Aminicenantales bacterium]